MDTKESSTKPRRGARQAALLALLAAMTASHLACSAAGGAVQRDSAALAADTDLHARLSRLQPGMSLEQVQQIMGPMDDLFTTLVQHELATASSQPARKVEIRGPHLVTRFVQLGGNAYLQSSYRYAYTSALSRFVVVFDWRGRLTHSFVEPASG